MDSQCTSARKHSYGGPLQRPLGSDPDWTGRRGLDRAVLTSTQAWMEMTAKSGAPWIGVLDDPEAFLGELCWQVSLTQAGQLDAHYERWTLPGIPTQMPGMPHNCFVTAQNY
jgi:hypothetical protein